MTIKTVLVPFLSEETAARAFEAAVAVAKRHRAHIRALYLRALYLQERALPASVYYPLDSGSSAEIAEALREAEQETEEKFRAAFDRLCKIHGVSICEMSEHVDAKGATASWKTRSGAILFDLAHDATACDLVVAATAGKQASYAEKGVFEGLIFQSGRPLLLCPMSGMGKPPGRVAIAWNGRAEAARAVAASLPFLQDADSVTVVTVRKPSAPLINTDELTAHLRLHGVNATMSAIELDKGQDELRRLQEEIEKTNPDLVVMGAYSHSRWREVVLGGFTRRVLHAADTPVLLMH